MSKLVAKMWEHVRSDPAAKARFFKPAIPGSHTSMVKDVPGLALRIDQGPPPSDPKKAGLKPAFFQINSAAKTDSEKALKKKVGTHAIISKIWIDTSIQDETLQDAHLDQLELDSYASLEEIAGQKASGSKKK
ncbi:hypothetical protein FRB94_003979 [Tulasnella sp. JGI-2019a]|nr:hypothetical protein FRB94_003979 [Tulasnella sp. JGI-2019a]KAG9017459.1 hypothetical protein FRB93_007574 [Tulasnella sp. JGI-2019a]KAG9023688.1 hypothetical protein FRB95_012635 [Tulasnella sp. JGI-2019a]